MTRTGQDSLGTRRTLSVGGSAYDYFSLAAAEPEIGDISRLPFCLKILLENLLRFEDGKGVSVADIKTLAKRQGGNGTGTGEKGNGKAEPAGEISYRPARVLMQDFTGVPAIVDLAAMRDAMLALGGDAQRINPLSPVDLVIDHSVMVDHFGDAGAFARNVELEFARNGERYEFLRWGQGAFDNFRVVPPGTGICHQVNLEYLAQCVRHEADAANPQRRLAFPDTLVGTDSHTTMINALGVLGWGVGGIEAEAAMLGQPVTMLIPDVVGFRLTGALGEGVTATDLVLTVVEMLRAHGVVGKFVEFHGPGLDRLSLADRATIANMAPEYGATCGIFPIDGETLNYLRFTGRDAQQIALVEAYAREQGLWREGDHAPHFAENLALDLAAVQSSLAGPKRPQDRVALGAMKANIAGVFAERGHGDARRPVAGADYELADGAVVIAAITSCTNTSNPSVLVAAGLLARAARARGLAVKPWVKTSLAPGSQVVSDYLAKAGLQEDLDALGFDLVGYGCTTCIGNSGPLPPPIADAIDDGDLVTVAVLSGNRNFEGRISPRTRANYLASPPLVVAYALAGNANIDLLQEPLGHDDAGEPVWLRDIWPSDALVRDTVRDCLSPDMFRSRYADVFRGPPEWQAIAVAGGETFGWNDASTYVQNPPYFAGITMTPEPVRNIESARALLILGDSVTTDHISPAGAFAPDSPAGAYLGERQVRPRDFNSYGSRRGNHQIMMRGTFANIRIRNELLRDVEGGFTRHMPSGERMSVFDAAMRYQQEDTPLIVFGGKEYGTGSSRDWAAKGTRLLGVRAVIVESFERIHRSNLVGMGVLPLQFMAGMTRHDLALDGSETFTIAGLEGGIAPRRELRLTISRADGDSQDIPLLCRIDTQGEADYYQHGGVLPYVLRDLAGGVASA